MTTLIFKALNFPKTMRPKTGPKLSAEDKRAFQKQLSDMAQNGMWRK